VNGAVQLACVRAIERDSQWARQRLFSVDPAPHNVLPATMLLILSSVIACLLPARRAASIHPVEALRYE
jgi:ABC-type lipoprotein release transport system permease subunit